MAIGGRWDVSHEIFLARTDAELMECFAVLRHLRPHLEADAFLPQVRRQEEQGYRVMALRHEGRVVSAAGFRRGEFLAWGRIVYVDDLATLPDARGRGFAGALLDRLIDLARREGCDALHLDTGYGRHAAHRLYLAKGLEMTSHHMRIDLRRAEG